jgi:hypothetical protein
MLDVPGLLPCPYDVQPGIWVLQYAFVTLTLWLSVMPFTSALCTQSSVDEKKE